MANWQGQFPWQNLLTDGYARTSPVGSFPANGYGLYDLIGNVWELTTGGSAQGMGRADKSLLRAAQPARRTPEGASSRAIRCASRARSLRGSHLCAANYCLRYRPAARTPLAIDTSTSHTGFRCIVRPPRQGKAPR